MSARDMCAAFFIRPAGNATEWTLAMAHEIPLTKLSVTTEPGFTSPSISGQWGPLPGYLWLRQLPHYWLFAITFPARDFYDIMNLIHNDPRHDQHDRVRDFVSVFARTCEVVDPDIAFIDTLAVEWPVDELEKLDRPLFARDYGTFVRVSHPLLYASERILFDVLSDLDGDPDGFWMKSGKVFYSGAGENRWPVYEIPPGAAEPE